GRLLQVYRNYLKLLVLSQLESKLQVRVSASDVVQDTFLEANRDFRSFRGSTSHEFRSWLRKILVNNLHRVVEQHVLAKKRDVRREVSLEALAGSLERSTARLEGILRDPGPTPSRDARRREVELALADTLAALPADYREVIMLRHIEALSFDDAAARMNRSPGAARMLWLRAIRMLRERMQESHG
ncbi:MAG: sigma-70 family RNA polymerase sigma factor, partial [Planctomycetota bacterium]